MSDPAVDVVEFLLTAHTYTEAKDLDEGDLPPRYRQVFWSDGSIERPLAVTQDRARTATSVDHPWDAVSDLLFTQRTEFSGEISLTQPDMALEWYLDRVEDERIAANPTLAHAARDEDSVSVTREEAREDNQPIQADRVWIDSLLDEYFDEEEDAEMLDLVHILAPEEIETTLDDLVLTNDQNDEVEKIVTAIENRDYLASIGLSEIGKILFVGPPGTGKTTISRGLAHELGLPFVEVKLSMVTSQYLGETAKNVEKTFEVAKRLSPCILFIDEFDSVAKTRKSDEHAALKRAVNTLLKSIDDISLVRDEVLTVAATNHPDQLDAAAWRRFDEVVNFPKPDRQMREDILRIITRDMQMAAFDPEEVADATEGLTGSDLRMVLREAVLQALTEGRRELTQDDVMSAVQGFEERDNLKNMDDFDNWEGSPGSGDKDDHNHGHDHDHDHDHDHESEVQKQADD